MKRSFTLIEIILVLVIVGIVASIGSEIVFKAYENYILSQQLSSATYKTDVALEQIAKRLEYRIPLSTVAIKDETNTSDIVSLSSSKTDYKILAWLGRAYEARRGSGNPNIPGWSGFIDLKYNNGKTLKTKGDDLNILTDIVYNLSGKDVNLSNSFDGAVIFQSTPYNSDIVTAYGWKTPFGTPPTHLFPAKIVDSSTINIDSGITNKPDRIYEHYYFTWTAYAIVPENNGDGTYTIKLYYDFQPWQAEEYKDGKSTILIDKATSFQFRRDGSAIELRLCALSDLANSEYNATICGKKVVF